jgi:hypothetical protein
VQAQNRLICAPRPTAPSTLPGVQIRRYTGDRRPDHCPSAV